MTRVVEEARRLFAKHRLSKPPETLEVQELLRTRSKVNIESQSDGRKSFSVDKVAVK
jgi:hypothetical protein